MEVAKRYSIAYKGLKDGSHDYHFEVDGALFADYGSEEIRDGKCNVEVCLKRAETMLSLEVEIEGWVVVPCDRCLEDCRIPVDFEGELLVKFSDEPLEYDGEVLWLHPAEDELNLMQYIYESIVLSLPYQRVHPEGECDPEMIERFRVISAQELSEIEARVAEQPKGEEWEKLAALKQQLETDDKK